MKTDHDGLGPIVTSPVASRRDERDWLELQSLILGSDPAWIRPLDIFERRRVSPRHNAFFTFGTGQRFIARTADGRAVGRISAQINSRHLARHGDATGHFGFFDCVDSLPVSRSLFAAATDWLKSRDCRRMTGPFNWSINEESGLLIEGFDSRPAVLMPHGAPWYKSHCEHAGLEKAVDILAYRAKPSQVPPVVGRLAALGRQDNRVSVRKFDMRKYEREVLLLIDIFNDAWSGNWGFVPFSDAEISAMIAETRYILRDGWGRFVLLDGVEAGFIFVLPDINGAVASFGGRLLPFNWMRLVRKFVRGDWQSSRIPLMGLRRVYHSSERSPQMLALLIAEFLDEARYYPLEWVEFSWILETNRAMRRFAELGAGPPVKRYRIFQTSLS